jgi:opacity protein-like surface antigen
MTFAVLAAALLFTLPRPAFASPGVFVGGSGGFTFQDSVPSQNFTGRAGVELSSRVDVFGEIGRTISLVPQAEYYAIANNAFAAARLYSPLAASIDGRVGALHGLGGARFRIDAGRLRPFAEAGVGVVRLSNNGLRATAFEGTNVTAAALANTFAADLPMTKPMFVVGAGISLPAGERAAVDLGYRYSRIAIDGPVQDTVNQGNAYGAFRVTF